MTATKISTVGAEDLAAVPRTSGFTCIAGDRRGKLLVDFLADQNVDLVCSEGAPRLTARERMRTFFQEDTAAISTANHLNIEWKAFRPFQTQVLKTQRGKIGGFVLRLFLWSRM
jgi:hypothetical protein